MVQVVVREADSADRAALHAFFREVRGEVWASRWDALYDWRWQRRPVAGGERGGYVGALAEAAGRVVASVSCLPAGLHVRGEAVEAYWQFDSLVHPDYRRRGLAGRLMTLHAGPEGRGGRGGILLAKGTSEAMLGARHKAGFADVPGSGFYVRTLRLAPRLARVTGGPIAATVAAVPDALLRRRLPAATVEVRRVELEFDHRFDDLWQRCRPGYPCIAMRDAATLRWRFEQHPMRAYMLLTLTSSEGGDLRGYAVLTMHERRGRPLGHVVDLLAAADDAPARRDLLAASLHELYRQGADSAACYATHPLLIDSLLNCGFHPKRRPDPMTRLGLIEMPYVTAADGD